LQKILHAILTEPALRSPKGTSSPRPRLSAFVPEDQGPPPPSGTPPPLGGTPPPTGRAKLQDFQLEKPGTAPPPSTAAKKGTGVEVGATIDRAVTGAGKVLGGVTETALPFRSAEEFLDATKDPAGTAWSFVKALAQGHWETAKKAGGAWLKAFGVPSPTTEEGKKLVATAETAALLLPNPNISPQRAWSVIKSVAGDHLNQWLHRYASTQMTRSASQQDVDFLKAMGYTGGTFAPVVGPQAVETAEMFPTDPLRATGRAVGLFAPLAVMKWLREIRPTAPGAPTYEMPVPLTRGQRTGSPVSLSVEGLLEKSLPGAAKFKELRARAQSALIDTMANRVVERISTFKGTSGDLMSQLKTWADTAQAEVEKQIGAEYGAIDRIVATQVRRTRPAEPVLKSSKAGLVDEYGRAVQIPTWPMQKSEVGGVVVSTAELKKIALQELKELRGVKQIYQHAQMSEYERDLSKMLKMPDYVSFHDMHNARSEMLRATRAITDRMASRRQAFERRVSVAARRAMLTAAHQYGEINPETDMTPLEARVIRTDRAWADAKFEFNKSVVSKLLKVDPTHLPQFIQNSPVEDVRYLKTHLDPKEWDNLTTHLLRGALENAITEETSLIGGEAAYNAAARQLELPQLPRETQRTLPGGAWTSELIKYGDRLPILFDNTTYRRVIEVDEIARRISSKSAVPGIFAAGLNAGLIYKTLQILTSPTKMGLKAAGSVAGIVGGTRLLATLVTHPEGMTRLRLFVRAVNSGVPAQIQYWGLRLSEVAAEDVEKRRQEEAKHQPPSGKEPPQ
jgi:hypothetical protein